MLNWYNHHKKTTGTLSKSPNALPIDEVIKTKQHSVILGRMLKVGRKLKKINLNQNGRREYRGGFTVGKYNKKGNL